MSMKGKCRSGQISVLKKTNTKNSIQIITKGQICCSALSYSTVVRYIEHGVSFPKASSQNQLNVYFMKSRQDFWLPKNVF